MYNFLTVRSNGNLRSEKCVTLMGKCEVLSCIAFDKNFLHINSLLKCHIRYKD